MWNLWLKLTTPRLYTSMIFNTLRLTLVETKENNKRLHQLHNIQPKKITNNMTMKYLHCYDHRNITQLLLAKKKKEMVILHDKLCRQHRATEGGNKMTRKALMKQ